MQEITLFEMTEGLDWFHWVFDSYWSDTLQRHYEEYFAPTEYPSDHPDFY